MIRWEHLGSAPIPDSEGELRLMRRGAEYSIMTGGTELMSSRMSGSEQALATLAIERLTQSKAPRILIGGLGMGFTLRAALAALPPDAQVEVAELVPAIVDWGRGPMAELFAGCLDDPRVTIRLGDVGALIRVSPATYDAILMDVDNGPGGLDRVANDSLYGHAGLETQRKALKPGGVLAVWSFAPDEYYVRRLRAVGFQVTEEKVAAHRKGRGRQHIIWLATPK